MHNTEGGSMGHSASCTAVCVSTVCSKGGCEVTFLDSDVHRRRYGGPVILEPFKPNQIKSNLLMQKGQLATNNANIKTV